MELMNIRVVTIAVLVLALLLSPMTEVAAHDQQQKSSPRTRPLRVECGSESYQVNSTYAGYVERTKKFIAEEAPQFWPSGPGQISRFPYQVEYIGQIKYRAACKHSATMNTEEDCRFCLQTLIALLGDRYCPRKYEAGIYSADCFVRWLRVTKSYSKQIPPWVRYV